ncbi:MAG: mannonate dehydratase [Gemmatimonadaceae bacterium]|jgi:mannonate dehydratase|nr:mannonate dehydratase [Gemmatimonadaceae bacterium]
MRLGFRWFGEGDPVRLAHIRQIPGMRAIVSSLHDLPPGAAWPRDRVARLRDTVERHGLSLGVIESIPVHEDIKLGRPARDALIDAWCASLEAVGSEGVPVVCYNFMPVFDWTRTELARVDDDGALALAYDDAALAAIDLARGTGDLPGWGAAYDARALGALLQAWRAVSAEQLWEHLAYFLERVVPVAARVGVKLAMHPDDPPWPIFGLPRIITDGDALVRLTRLVDDPHNGITFCTGSLGAAHADALPAMVRRVAGRIHFAHCRNVKVTAPRVFHESAHPTAYGSVDMYAVLRALHDTGFDGPMRPDHGRMIWDETGRPGYGLHDRALGATYLYGLWEAVSRSVDHG